MKDWAKPLLDLADHAKTLENALALYGSKPKISPQAALELEARLDRIVACANDIDDWIARHTHG
jgi:hypothetical protein